MLILDELVRYHRCIMRGKGFHSWMEGPRKVFVYNCPDNQRNGDSIIVSEKRECVYKKDEYHLYRHSIKSSSMNVYGHAYSLKIDGIPACVYYITWYYEPLYDLDTPLNLTEEDIDLLLQ